MAVGGDDLVAAQQEAAARSSGEVTARVTERGRESERGREGESKRENNIKDKERELRVNRLMHFTHGGRAD